MWCEHDEKVLQTKNAERAPTPAWSPPALCLWLRTSQHRPSARGPPPSPPSKLDFKPRQRDYADTIYPMLSDGVYFASSVRVESGLERVICKRDGVVSGNDILFLPERSWRWAIVGTWWRHQAIPKKIIDTWTTHTDTRQAGKQAMAWTILPPSKSLTAAHFA
jgi:hypothetical protein